TIGTGCGTQPLTLEALTARGPVYASQFVSKVRNVPQGLAFMALGVSNTAVGPLLLPFDLAGFGGTGGCTLYHDTAIDLAAPCVPSATGEATHTFTVPNLPSITGLPVFLQAWAPDSAFNALGLVTSNALRTTIGNN
ncbi:MAG: hypothetical protein RL148_977, partial [Planctomycetota bacterium]